MEIIWLIYNPRSKTADETLVDQIADAFAQAGRPIRHRIELGETALPSVADLRRAGVTLLVELSGDGSINALASELDGWEGTLLVLPGGTMNLLSKALHGEASVPQIVERVLAGQARRQQVPVILHENFVAYTGIIAGPTAAWGDVREDLRKGDIVALGQDALHAVSATLEDPGVSVDGSAELYPAIFIEPGEDALQVSAVIAENAGHLLAHGWAWLMGDFRKGPFQPLDGADQIALCSSGRRLELLVDGEQMKASEPAIFRSGRSSIAFLATRQDDPH
ncbi:MAG TPA: diacylglycerol kinase family protein [Sphingobium sp.]